MCYTLFKRDGNLLADKSLTGRRPTAHRQHTNMYESNLFAFTEMFNRFYCHIYKIK